MIFQNNKKGNEILNKKSYFKMINFLDKIGHEKSINFGVNW